MQVVVSVVQPLHLWWQVSHWLEIRTLPKTHSVQWVGFVSHLAQFPSQGWQSFVDPSS